ncbi:MAG: hypothetical protein RL660_292 [Bacteroidota bacterium]|jgi:endonuclease/exonuclease/phosphatase family metal-dependent hydrolase
MKIGTINMDWLKNKKSQKSFFLEDIEKQDLDFIIITETLDSFNLSSNYNKIQTNTLPTAGKYEYLDYGAYNKGELSVRVAIFSKHQFIEPLDVIEKFTSVAGLYKTPIGEIIVYGTIIGTWGIQKQKEIAEKELNNFINDIEKLSTLNKQIIIGGDLNTSLKVEEKRSLTQIDSRNALTNFFNKHNLTVTTKDQNHCIDHIIISEGLATQFRYEASEFLDNGILKDEPHVGVLCSLINKPTSEAINTT